MRIAAFILQILNWKKTELNSELNTENSFINTTIKGWMQERKMRSNFPKLVLSVFPDFTSRLFFLHLWQQRIATYWAPQAHVH